MLFDSQTQDRLRALNTDFAQSKFQPSNPTIGLQSGTGSRLNDLLQPSSHLFRSSAPTIHNNLSSNSVRITSLTDDDAGNTLATARDIGTLSSSQTFSDFVGSSDTDDYYRFTLDTTSVFNLSLTGLSADADVQLIRDANGNGVVDFGEVITGSFRFGNSAETIANGLANGTYFIRVYQFSGDTSYDLSVSATPFDPPPDHAGNTLATARDIGTLSSPQTFGDFVNDIDINDYYRFSLDTTSTFNLSLTGLSADADVQLIRDANGNGVVDLGEVIAYPYQDGTLPETLTAGLTTGTYFIRVFQYSGDTPYDLSVSAAPLVLPDGYNLTSGYGLVNAAAAVAEAIGQSPFSAVPDLSGYDWGLDLVNAPEVWARGYTGQNIVVAVVDTGVDYTHPDLNDNIWRNANEIAGNGLDDDENGYVDDVWGWDFVGRDNDPMDLESHGTHVAGTIAAEQNGFGVTGVAYNASIMPVRVLNEFGSGTWIDIAAGIRYAADNGANVINLSLGGGYSDEVAAAVQHATQQGAMVVMAAGNAYGIQPGFPASLANQWGIAVGAVNINRQLADFSNRAGIPLNYVAAPGVNVYSTTPNNSYASFSGTSMAAPHVAGVVALMLSANPNLTPAQVASLLTQTADPNGVAA